MGNYVWSTSGIQRDELQGRPGQLVDIWNVNVGASAVIERGMLLCADSFSGIFDVVGSASDASKVLGIAVENFTADDERSVTQVYSSGFFNREKIKLGGNSLTIEPFVNELRKQNLHLTTLQEKF